MGGRRHRTVTRLRRVPARRRTTWRAAASRTARSIGGTQSHAPLMAAGGLRRARAAPRRNRTFRSGSSSTRRLRLPSNRPPTSPAPTSRPGSSNPGSSLPVSRLRRPDTHRASPPLGHPSTRSRTGASAPVCRTGSLATRVSRGMRVRVGRVNPVSRVNPVNQVGRVSRVTRASRVSPLPGISRRHRDRPATQPSIRVKHKARRQVWRRVLGRSRRFRGSPRGRLPNRHPRPVSSRRNRPVPSSGSPRRLPRRRPRVGCSSRIARPPSSTCMPPSATCCTAVVRTCTCPSTPHP